MRAAEIKDIGLRTPRHSVTTALVDGGANIRDVSELLDHSLPAITTGICLHGSAEGKRSAVTAMSEMLGI